MIHGAYARIQYLQAHLSHEMRSGRQLTLSPKSTHHPRCVFFVSLLFVLAWPSVPIIDNRYCFCASSRTTYPAAWHSFRFAHTNMIRARVGTLHMTPPWLLYQLFQANFIFVPLAKVLDMILKHLACDGQAFVASKRFYFGTGGSTKHFRDRAAADGRLICVNEVVIDTGKGNIREVLRVSWR